MNGASTEPLARINNPSSNSKQITMGAIHHFLRSRKNSRNSVVYHPARSGGEIAGRARRKLEKETGRPVLSAENNLRVSGPSKELLTFTPSLEEKVNKFAKSKSCPLSEEETLD